MAGAALAFSGCGGVLGSGVSPTIEAVVPVNCAVDNAVAEDQNYGNAVFDATSGLPFTGTPRNDFLNAANRNRIFGARLAELERQRAVLAALEPKDDIDRQFVAASRKDLAQAEALMRFDRKWKPADPKTPTTTPPVPSAIQDLLPTTSDAVQKRFNACAPPADLAKRTKEYGG